MPPTETKPKTSKPAVKKTAGAKSKKTPKPKATRKAHPGPSPALRARALEIEATLAEAMPAPKCELDHSNAFELLIAVILSAQTTDRGVNMVTPELFRRFPTPAALSKAPQAEVEQIIRRTGFFRVKAQNIRATAKLLVDRHHGEVPREMADLVKLPGVARKSASVVLGTAFNIAQGIAVDTHAQRVTRRLALVKGRTPLAIERELMALFPREGWPALQHRVVLHGRYVCTARSPRCAECPIRALCNAAEKRAVLTAD